MEPPVITLQRLDHLVLTVTDVAISCEFYSTVLGCEIVCFTSAGQKRYALRIGGSPQKINLHPAEAPFNQRLQPVAQTPQPGSADLCFITSVPLDNVVEHLQRLNVTIIEGPVERTGTLGSILSVYIRDPDGNLIEIANAL